MTVHETGDAQPMQITRSFRHRITNSGRRSNYREGENISLHFAKKKKSDAANLASTHKPHVPTDKFLPEIFFTRKEGKSTCSFGNAQITITIPTKSGARRMRDQG